MWWIRVLETANQGGKGGRGGKYIRACSARHGRLGGSEGGSEGGRDGGRDGGREIDL